MRTPGLTLLIAGLASLHQAAALIDLCDFGLARRLLSPSRCLCIDITDLRRRRLQGCDNCFDLHLSPERRRLQGCPPIDPCDNYSIYARRKLLRSGCDLPCLEGYSRDLSGTCVLDTPPCPLYDSNGDCQSDPTAFCATLNRGYTTGESTCGACSTGYYGAATGLTACVPLPDCSAVALTAGLSDTIWPANNKFLDYSVTGFVNAGKTEISAIAQNEAVGCGKEDAPDAKVNGAAAFSVRAQRLGTGSGRLYKVTAKAYALDWETNTNYATCTATVLVKVSKSQGATGAVNVAAALPLATVNSLVPNAACPKA